MNLEKTAVSLLQKHLKNLIAEETKRETLINFIASLVQFPDRKMKRAILIQAAAGSGKTFLAELVRSVVGHESLIYLTEGELRSGFNGWLEGTKIVILEEAFVGEAGLLKSLVSCDRQVVKEKFRPSRTVPANANVLAFSSQTGAVSWSSGDRRVFVIKSPLQHKSQVLALGESYFPNLFKMLRGNAEELRAYFAGHKIPEHFFS
jgi:hypothetical protein